MALNTSSIGLRLVVGAATWIVAALILTVWFLSAAFRDHAQTDFDEELNGHLVELLMLVDVDAQGRAVMTSPPIDPRTVQPYSGWYWIVSGPRQKPLRSRSLWDQELALPELPPRGETVINTIQGSHQKLRTIARTITLPGSKDDFLFMVTGPQADVDKAIRKFVSMTAIALGLLGLGLFGALILQVLYGLKPLRHIREALADVNAGRLSRLEGEFPSEVRPLVDELNGLLEHNAKVLERARTHVGNLAHALKTPVAVLRNLATKTDGEVADTLSRQTEDMHRHVDHHLRRARMAGAGKVLGVRTEVAEVAESMIKTMGRVFIDRPRKGILAGQRNLWFHGERQDLEELLGNLVENAFKWAKGQVRVTITPGRNESFPIKSRILIAVEDDGPGIPADKRVEALGRGKRLDESTPGTGLGLSIVNDLADMYEGTLTLDVSEWGGLKAVLDLPASVEEKTDKPDSWTDKLHLPHLPSRETRRKK